MYLIILSNSPAPSFPENTSANFTVPLNFPLRTPFSEKWKVALLKVILPNTFYNVETEDYISVEYTNRPANVITFREGIYLKPKELIKQLNKYNDDFHGLEVKEHPQSFPIVSLYLYPNVNKVQISPNLSKLLGLEENIENNFVGEDIFSNKKEYDPWINHRVLLVHSNLVRTSQVNDKQLNVLQSLIPSDLTHFHGVTSKDYFPPDYLDVQGEFFSSLSFRITDINDKLVKFRAGSVVLVLDIIKNG